jgi:glycyl-tRNA synthetase beta chain
MSRPAEQSAATGDLLIEIGCEELPPKALDTLRDAFFTSVQTELDKNAIAFDIAGSRSFSTPRRLAVLLADVAGAQPDQVQERRGPAVSVAFDADGKPSGAALGFARSVGTTVDALERVKTDKGEWLFARQHVAGKPLSELIYPILEQAVKSLPVPRPMRWSNHDFSFVRPVHWLIVLHGDTVLPGTLLGQSADNLTRGHRVHSPGPHRVARPADYLSVLEQARVIADPQARRKRIRQQLADCSERVHIDDDLLSEVNNLVEWPVAVECTFDEEFLEVPHEALIASMQDHQKFFPVLTEDGTAGISNRFIAIANSESLDPPAVREGFERVIRPRLADARFFLQQDLKRPLSAYSSGLDHVVFQEKIGTIGDKSRRIAILSKQIADLIGADSTPVSRAALLAKCDLLTQMVGEFPELQGIMGKHYALASGEDGAVAAAIEEHYLPRFAGDRVPATVAGQVVGIADRLDTLVGIFTAGLRPTGNKDPFALRRAALGLLRILLEQHIELPLKDLLELAAAAYRDSVTVDRELLEDVHDFIVDRARNLYRERGFSTELINAVLASSWHTLPDLDSRARALAAFMGEEAAESLAAANKRIGNILRKSGETISTKIDADSLNLPEERVLFAELESLESTLGPLLQANDYAAGLAVLAGLREPVDAFFDGVMVMDEDAGLRANRLALLARVKSLFDRIADLSVLG